MDIVNIIGQIILGGLLIMSGLNHFIKMDASVAYAGSKKVPMPGLAVAFTGLMLLFGGIAIVGWWSGLIVPGLIVLAVFFLFTTLIMHAFWKESGEKRMSEMHYFMGNMMLFGALLILLFRSS